MQNIIKTRNRPWMRLIGGVAVIAWSLAGIVPLANSGGAASANDKVTTDKSQPVSLQLAVSMDDPGTTLVWILTNNSGKEILTLPEGNTTSYLVVTYPDGKIEKLISPIDHLDVSTVKPAQTVMWKQDMSQKIGRYAFVKPGMYRFYWEWREFKYRRSEAGQYYRSNEILLLRGKVVDNSLKK